MIAVILHDLRWRLAAVFLIAILFFFAEPGFDPHLARDPEAIALGPLGISASLSHLAALTMIVLLGGYISRDYHEGYTRLYFAHPTSPLAFYGLRFGMAYSLAVLTAAIFLVVGQVIAWRTVPTGWAGLALPLLSALMYGGLVTLLSVVLPRGDSWIVFFLLVLPAGFPQLLNLWLSALSPALRQLILFILPPQGALQNVWQSLLEGPFAWDAAVFAAAYGVVLLLASGLILWTREWP